MKKGRHRRFEEARALKRSGELDVSSILDDGLERPTEPCPECGAAPGASHESWCLHDEVEDED